MDLLVSSADTQFILVNSSLRWRHNEWDDVSNHQPQDCLLNRLSGRRSKKISKPRVTGLCAGNSPGTGEFPAQMASNAEICFHLMTSSWLTRPTYPFIIKLRILNSQQWYILFNRKQVISNRGNPCATKTPTQFSLRPKTITHLITDKAWLRSDHLADDPPGLWSWIPQGDGGSPSRRPGITHCVGLFLEDRNTLLVFL